jgi:hypothetical protein
MQRIIERQVVVFSYKAIPTTPDIT